MEGREIRFVLLISIAPVSEVVGRTTRVKGAGYPVLIEENLAVPVDEAKAGIEGFKAADPQ